MASPQRCGTVDNPHKFDPDVVVPRCTKCNKHLRDIHVSDSIDSKYPRGTHELHHLRS